MYLCYIRMGLQANYANTSASIWFMLDLCVWASTYPSLPIPIFCTKDPRAVCSSLSHSLFLSFQAANQTIDNDNDILKWLWLWLWCKCLRIIYKSSVWAAGSTLTNYDKKKRERARERERMIIIHVESSKPHLCTEYIYYNCRVQRKKNYTIIIIEPC